MASRGTTIFCISPRHNVSRAAGSSARLDWLEHQLQTHAKAKFDLLVLPELFACGYNIGDAVKRVAEPVDEPIAMQMAALARRYNLAIQYGFAERDGDKL